MAPSESGVGSQSFFGNDVATHPKSNCTALSKELLQSANDSRTRRHDLLGAARRQY